MTNDEHGDCVPRSGCVSIAKGWTPQAAYPGGQGMTNDESRRGGVGTAKRLRHIAKGWTPQAAYPGGQGMDE